MPTPTRGTHQALTLVAGASTLIDVLDRVLDKGIVIDAWASLSQVGIHLITVEGRVCGVVSDNEPQSVEDQHAEMVKHLGKFVTAAEQKAYLHGLAVGLGGHKHRR